MYTGTLSLTAVILLQLSQAQPAHIGHVHRHEQRDVVTDVAYVTAASPAAVVVVDQNGNTLSTSYASQQTDAPPPAAYSAPAPPPAPPAPNAAPPPPPAGSEAKSVSAAAAPSPAASAPQAPPSGSSGASTSGGGPGINYSPYHADGSCKNGDQVSKDFEQLNGYSIVRSYGTDCNQVPNIMSAAKTKNMKVMLGVFDVDNTPSEIQTLIGAAKNDWGMVDSVSIGNEEVNSKGTGRIGAVLNALGTAKGALSAAGYKGPVVTVDTFNTLIANPQLCQASDYAAANAHSFFDSDITPDKAGTWAQGTAQRVKDACGGKKTVITESGWPSGGSANGNAKPSPQNQQTAVSSLKQAFPNGGLFLFSAYNDQWKSDSGDFGCEKYWGIYGNSSN